MKRFEKNNLKIILDKEMEQFVAYDFRGKAVVLQKNAEHPGRPFFREPRESHSTELNDDQPTMRRISPSPSNEIETRFANVQVKLSINFRASSSHTERLDLFQNVKQASAILAHKLTLSRG